LTTEYELFFLGLWRELLARSQCGAGCAVLAVTVATDSPELLHHARAVFRSWRAQLAEVFERGGLSTQEATRFAATLVAASEGAVVLSRAEQSLEPFNLVAEQLLEQVRKMSPG
jgi:TetR/AcrR family transcriptional regulator, lmrAB and yxaGH operons repressor